MGSVKERRQQARFMVQWPMLYANEELIGRGTLVNVSHAGCQIVGTMPVAVGMLLKVWVSPGHREEALYVKEARVLWAKEHEFGLELRDLTTNDQRWLRGYIETAERRNSFRVNGQSASTDGLAAMPLALPVKEF
jgi:hypothetical protein